MSISNIVCIAPESDDCFDSFGASVVINNKYLAIGDFLSNRVVIYTRDNSGQWNRSRTILPPKDSVPDQFGIGFGKNLQLDGNFLIVSVSVFQELKYVTNPEDFQEIIKSTCYFRERYLVNLDCETEVKPIGLAIEKNPGLITFNLLSEGEIKKVTLSDRGEKGFGASFAYCQNMLLVGSPSYEEETGAWLYDLDRLEREPEKLASPNVLVGGTVALNEKFAAVSVIGDHSGVFRIYPQYMLNKSQKTLIKAIDNGSTNVFNGIGELSLSGNILARMRPLAPHVNQCGLLEVFRLDENATPNFILRQEPVVNAFVQNCFLITVTDDHKSGFEVCVSSIV